MVDTILKWAGGKERLLEDLYARFPDKYVRYHEPMIGGGALFFDLGPKDATINDTNSRLINFYMQVRDHHEELIELCRSFNDPESPPDPSREFSNTCRDGKEIKNYYYQQRALFNRRPNDEEFDPLEEAALLLYLNRTCYNGLYRENSSGEFNVPIGRYENPDWVRAPQVRKASEILQRVEIYNRDFSYLLEVTSSGDVVYFDPPYKPMSPTANFTEYSASGFDKEDQKRLLDIAQKLHRREVWVILSNSGVMYERYNDRGFYVDKIGASRPISSDPETRGEVDEIIATNVAPQKRSHPKKKKLLEYNKAV